jgi:segregation and condensation protein A
MSAPPAISLPRFEGPLDLLLALVRKNQVAITDIPIAEITRQYLEYVIAAEKLDVNLGAEFIHMAATLIHIKSRSLLPTDPETASREPDPRQELIRQLLDYDQVRQAAEFLREQLEINEAAWTRPSIHEFEQPPAEPDQPADPASMNLLEILELAQKALETARTHDLLQLDSTGVTIAEMMLWLQSRLSGLNGNAPLSCDALFAEQPAPPRQIALFLAMLELAKAGGIRLEQDAPFAPIYLAREKIES